VARAPVTLLAVLLCLTGCASVRMARCPAQGGPEWRELVTDHFVVRTNLPTRRAAKLAGRLERMRAAVAASLGVEAVQPGRVEVIAFRSAAEYRAFAPLHADGYYLRYSGGPPRIVMSARAGPSERALLAHELTHHFLSGAFWRQPRWLSEGLAVYMEAIGEDEPTGETVHMGGIPGKRLMRARQGLVPMRELLAWEQDPSRRLTLEYYATSWVLVHWLVHRRPAALADLQRRLAAGEEPLLAWTAALPDYPPTKATALEALDYVLTEYLVYQLIRESRELPVPPAVGYFERPMPSEEVHALHLTLWNNGPDRGREALEAEVKEALSEAPDHPIALSVKAQVLKEGNPEEMARRSVEAYPGDPRAWIFLGLSLPIGDERTHAFEKAVEYAAQNPAALHQLAADLLDRGRSGEALPWARKAANLAPWSPPLLATYARALSDVGWCKQAVPYQLRAIETLPENTVTSERLNYHEKLHEYRAQCGQASPSSVADGPAAPGGAR